MGKKYERHIFLNKKLILKSYYTGGSTNLLCVTVPFPMDIIFQSYVKITFIISSLIFEMRDKTIYQVYGHNMIILSDIHFQ